MSDDQNTPPADEQTPPPAPQDKQDKQDKQEAPPWGEDFDPARAWKTIQSLRAREAELTPLAKKAKELEDAQKSETQKLTERAEAAERERDSVRTEALRLRIAAEKGLTVKQAARLRGSTEEELSADADDLLSELQPGRRQFGDVDQGVRGGTTAAPQDDPAKLADAVVAQRGY